MLDAEPQTTIMDFPVALRAVHARMCSSLLSLSGGPWRLHVAKSALSHAASRAQGGEMPPAWAALSLFLGFVAGLCCSGRATERGTAKDDAPLAHPPRAMAAYGYAQSSTEQKNM